MRANRADVAPCVRDHGARLSTDVALRVGTLNLGRRASSVYSPDDRGCFASINQRLRASESPFGALCMTRVKCLVCAFACASVCDAGARRGRVRFCVLFRVRVYVRDRVTVHLSSRK
mmetsp:Transcript_88546/g.266425  ORF Transcript_88546/g.266425 Transcript_88546/m.266425 type:complete len:117 (+) Transcript_88546:511-861(+)